MSSIPSSAQEEAITTNAYHMDDVDNIIMKVATDLNVEYISLYKKMNEYLDLKDEELSTYLNSDGLHPNDAGYTLMFKLILPALGFGQKYRIAT
nr:MAG TPA: Isoamyl acetate hydrolase-like protein [Caudoviricetes sp.]